MRYENKDLLTKIFTTNLSIVFIFLLSVFSIGLIITPAISAVDSNLRKSISSHPALSYEEKNLLLKRHNYYRNLIKEKTLMANLNRPPYADIYRESSSTGQLIESYAAYLWNDLAENLVYNHNTMIRNIYEMDKAKLTEGKIDGQPWSDDYWPYYKGSIAYRYTDPDWGKVEGRPENPPNNDDDWKYNREYVLKNPANTYLTNERINLLSPAEKYDLLIGDDTFKLTEKVWKEGERFYNSAKKVETWMGICHGWAPASFMVPRPLKSIKVISADGKYTITFYPSDIKALWSQLWANISFRASLVGGRCELKASDIKKDPASGRILPQECFDNNPGTWHMSIVNQVGVVKKSFIIDANYDYEVWNQPVLSYKYSYFNPETSATFPDAKRAVIAIKDYKKDKFTKFRSPEAKFIVGVKMDFTYLSETFPSDKDDSPDLDAIVANTYSYDLELDEKGNILGGEWYQDAHPNFMWVPSPEVKAYTYFDKKIFTKWDPTKDSLPIEWSLLAKRSVDEATLPLGRILYALTAASRGSTEYFEELYFE